MKKEIKKGILLVTLVATMISYAAEPLSFNIENDVNKTTLSIATVKIGQHLIIKDSYGMILYREIIEKSGTYNKAFDLTTLPDGSYFFELDKDFVIQIIPFKVTLAKVEFLKEKETKFFKPHVKLKENKLFLSRLNLNDEPLNVEVYYSASDDSTYNELIHSENIKDKRVIERVYALQKEKKGEYKVIMTVDSRKFITTLSL